MDAKPGHPDLKALKINYLQSISIIGLLFFIFGFVTWLNGTLIPFFKISCELDNFQAYFVTFAFYISYFVFAIPASAILQKTGFKKGMALGLLVMAIGSVVFIPAANMRYFSLFLVGLFIQGAGLSILQTASNPYVTIIGPIESAAKRISIMGICNKVAGVISPILLGTVVLKNIDKIKASLAATSDTVIKANLLNELAARVIIPYIIIALVLCLLAIFVFFSPLPNIDTDKSVQATNQPNRQKNTVLKFPYLILGVIALFFYVGAEVIAGDTIILYGQSLGIELSRAKVFTSYTLASMVVGYILGISLIPKYITQSRALLLSAAMGVVFTFLALFTAEFTSVLFIAMLGLANAIMWPAIWPLAIEGLGKFTKIGSALLIMGIAGGAIIPPIYGKLADVFNAQKAYWILVPLYVFIMFYAAIGHKIGKEVVKHN